jgi:hypothetical protein
MIPFFCLRLCARDLSFLKFGWLEENSIEGQFERYLSVRNVNQSDSLFLTFSTT